MIYYMSQVFLVKVSSLTSSVIYKYQVFFVKTLKLHKLTQVNELHVPISLR